MLAEVKKKLSDEVELLNHELSVTLPAALKKALANGDLRENGDYHAALERQQFVQVRLTHLRSRLSKLSQIDVTKIPVDSVGLGSRVVVQDLGTRARETYELVLPDAMSFDDPGQISVASPLGRAMIEKKAGDIAVVQLPGGIRKLRIVEVTTFHQQHAK